MDDHEKQIHELTLEAFRAQAWANPCDLPGHGAASVSVKHVVMHWRVTWRGRELDPCIALSAGEAIARAHRRAVNRALYLNTLGGASGMLGKPSMPPAEVLAEYPDLVEAFVIQGGKLEAVQAPAGAVAEVEAQALTPVMAQSIIELLTTIGENSDRHPDWIDAVCSASEKLPPGTIESLKGLAARAA